MVSLQLDLDSPCDKVVQILGLKEDNIETVISNVFVYFYGLEMLYLQSPKSACCSISDDLSCSYMYVVSAVGL